MKAFGAILLLIGGIAAFLWEVFKIVTIIAIGVIAFGMLGWF